jgi:excisionase family DNA binding protein
MDFQERPYTVQEVAAKLRIDMKSVYRLLLRGKLVGYKPAGEWRIWPADLAAYVESKRFQPAVHVPTTSQRMARDEDEQLARLGVRWS